MSMSYNLFNIMLIILLIVLAPIIIPIIICLFLFLTIIESFSDNPVKFLIIFSLGVFSTLTFIYLGTVINCN